MQHRRAVANWIRWLFAKLFKGNLIPATTGAKWGFVVGATYLLTLGQWWLVIQSIGELVVVMLLGAFLATFVDRLRWASRQPLR